MIFLKIVLICAALLFDAGAAPLSAQETAYYSKEDFYYINKQGQRVFLDVYPLSMVLRFNPAATPIEIKRVFGEIGQIAVEKIKVSYGAAEAKQSIGSVEMYVVTFSAPVNVVELLNLLVAKKEISDAAPVFRMNGDLVFPAGIWVREKYASPVEKQRLLKKVTDQGYQAQLSSRLNYYFRLAGFVGHTKANSLRLSRWLAEDVLVVWSIPDFVPIRQLISVSTELARLSGTINTEFVAIYRIRYDEKRILVDIEALKNTNPLELKPEAVAAGLFRTEKLEIRESVGGIVVKAVLRIYEPGEFLLSPLVIRYAFLGARSDVPPETLNSDTPMVKIAALVPRDKEEKPTVTDILGWKNMPPALRLLPEKPKRELYAPTDLRFYTESLYQKYPTLGLRLMQIAYALLFIAMLFGGSILVGNLRETARKRRASAAYEFKLALKHYQDAAVFLKAAKKFMREILNAPEGKTASELKEDCPDNIQPTLSELLRALDECGRAETLSKADANLVSGFLYKLKREARVRRWIS